MCGLVGAFAARDSTAEALLEPVRAGMARTARRGPDDAGEWADARCALGFRRLAILDLSPDGHQPMTTRDGRFVLVFNGEIYNFRDIAVELAGVGVRPRSTGDAEVLLLALATWGIDALRRLDGMFAFALYDTREHALLLARDHAGIKPLHYAITGEGVVFGSQYDAVLAHPWMRGAPADRDALALYLRLGFIPAPYGLHRGARQVEAGAWVQVTAGGQVTHGRHHSLPRWRAPDLSGADALDAFDAVFARAVKRHLESDVPVGVLLSGGIDSPLVAAEAVKQHGGALAAFTIGVEGKGDESADAHAYALELGLREHLERITQAEVLGLLDDVIAASTEPTADFSMFPMLVVSRLAHRHVKVVLSGDGGDELFWGYPSRFISAISQAPYFARSRLGRLAAIADRRLFDRGAATRDLLAHSTVGDLYLKKHTLLAEGDLGAIFPTLPALPTAFDAFQCDDDDPDRVAQFVRWNELHVHLSRVLAKVDRASMFHSLEVRVPLLAKEVIDVAWRTSWRSCLDLDTRIGKQVLRGALARRVKHSTLAKLGFTVPMAAWLRGPLRPLVDQQLIARRELLGLPLAPGTVRALHQRLDAGDESAAWGLWLLLSLALWDERYGAGAAR